MTFVELRSLMAAQIYAGLAARASGGGDLDIHVLAKEATEAAKAIEDEVAQQQTPTR